MGEASNPGPVQTRQARRLERSNPTGPTEGFGSTQVEPSSDEEILVRPNSGRHVVPRTIGELYSVPPVGGSQRSLTSGTVGEPETTVSASPQAPIAAGMAETDNELSRGTIHEGGHSPVQFPGCADREDDDCSSAGSESCWSEMEHIGDDDVIERGALPLPMRQMESIIEPCSNRFAALAGAETFPAGTRRSQRTVTDCATLLDSDLDAPLLSRAVSGLLLDALEEDLMQPVIPH